MSADLEELAIQNNVLMYEVLQELKALNSKLGKTDLNECTPQEALEILGLGNERYLKYYYDKKIIDRRRGGKGFLYLKDQCKALNEKFRNKELIPPPVKAIYDKAA